MSSQYKYSYFAEQLAVGIDRYAVGRIKNGGENEYLTDHGGWSLDRKNARRFQQFYAKKEAKALFFNPDNQR